MRTIKIVKLHPKALVPRYETAGSAGVDLRVVFTPGQSAHMLRPGEIKVFHTGLAMQIPRGMEGQVRSRSGLSAKYGIQVVNAPGTIDSDYRGEIRVPLINLGTDAYWVGEGERVAQLVFSRVEQMDFTPVSELDDTVRGDGGFGSTGKK